MRALLPALLLSIGLVAGCKKKVELPPPEPEPEPVVESEPPPPPPPPSCPARDSLVGTWHLVTEVSPGASPRMDGVNGYYTMNVRARDVGCGAQIEMTKIGWGRGSKQQSQNLQGRVNVQQEGRWWKLPIPLGAGAERTEMAIWLRQGSGGLQGYWYYANASWGQAPLYGIIEGRKEPMSGKPNPLPGMQGELDRCALKGKDSVGYDDCKPQ